MDIPPVPPGLSDRTILPTRQPAPTCSYGALISSRSDQTGFAPRPTAGSSGSDNAKRPQLTALHDGRKLLSSIVRLCKDKLMKDASTTGKNELLPGTLEMLILKTLST